jgi:hypothetical protein
LIPLSVKVINAGANPTPTLGSSEIGSFSAASLPPGLYRIEASTSGFQSAHVDGIRLGKPVTNFSLIPIRYTSPV